MRVHDWAQPRGKIELSKFGDDCARHEKTFKTVEDAVSHAEQWCNRPGRKVELRVNVRMCARWWYTDKLYGEAV